MSQNNFGFVAPLVVIGLGAYLIKPKRGFFPFSKEGIELSPIVAQVTHEEVAIDQLQITDHPVEKGSVISDHAFKMPAEIVIRCAWSNSASIGLNSLVHPTSDSSFFGGGIDKVKAVYAALLQLQVSGVPFDVWTGKRQYTNMLFKGLTQTTDKMNENSLLITAHCRQVLIVATRAITIPINTSAQAQPKATTPTQNMGQCTLQDAPGYVGS